MSTKTLCDRCPEVRRAEEALAELGRMKARPVEREFARLDQLWQELVAEKDKALKLARESLDLVKTAEDRLRHVERVLGDALVRSQPVVPLRHIPQDTK